MSDRAADVPADELPEGWAWAELGEILPLQYGKGLPKRDRDRSGTVPVFGSSGHVDTHNIALTSGPAIVVGRKGNAGAVYYSPQPCWPIDTAYYVEPEPDLDPEFFAYLLDSLTLASHDQSTAIPSLIREVYNRVRVPVPPTDEQHRIVEKIDTLLSEIANGVESLDAVDSKLASYRRSVLNQAFTRLIAKPTEIGSAGNSNNGLHYSRIGDVFQVFTGATPSKKIPDYWGGGIPWVSSGEVSFRNIKETRQTISRRGYDSCSVRLHPKGTVLLAMIGEGKTRGQAAILDIEACNNQNAAAIRVSETDIPPKFLYYYFMYKYEENRRIGSGGNQPALSRSRVQSIKFPHPPIDVMHQCVDYIEDALARAQQVEQAVSIPFRQSSALRRSIMSSAFSGRLVPQNSSEEPAAELLARIRADRTNAPKTSGRRGRPRKTSGTSEGATP